MNSQLEKLEALLTEIYNKVEEIRREARKAIGLDKDASVSKDELQKIQGSKLEGFANGQRHAEREIISRLYRAGASDKMLQSARVNLSQAEFNKHIASLQREVRNAPEIQKPPGRGMPL